MNKRKRIKIGEVVAVIISLILSYFLFANLNPEGWLKKDMTPISLSDIPKSDHGDYPGRVAGEDIKRLTGSKAFIDLSETEYVTVVPGDIVKTGVYGFKPWKDLYKSTTVKSGKRFYSTGRKPSEATNSFLFAAMDYIPYYLIKLPDDSYILAQFSDTDKKAVEKDRNAVLSLGIRKNTGNQSRTYLKEICEKYGANEKYVLYAVDNQWNDKNEFTIFIIRFLISAVACLILSVAFITVGEKLGGGDKSLFRVEENKTI